MPLFACSPGDFAADHYQVLSLRGVWPSKKSAHFPLKTLNTHREGKSNSLRSWQKWDPTRPPRWGGDCQLPPEDRWGRCISDITVKNRSPSPPASLCLQAPVSQTQRKNENSKVRGPQFVGRAPFRSYLNPSPVKLPSTHTHTGYDFLFRCFLYKCLPT